MSFRSVLLMIVLIPIIAFPLLLIFPTVGNHRLDSYILVTFVIIVHIGILGPIAYMAKVMNDD